MTFRHIGYSCCKLGCGSKLEFFLGSLSEKTVQLFLKYILTQFTLGQVRTSPISIALMLLQVVGLTVN
jgi:hypothetical protein